MFRRFFFAIQHRVSFLERYIKHAHFSRCRDIARRAALKRSECLKMRMSDVRAWVCECKEAACQIRVCISFQLEHERFRAAFQPDFATHGPFDTIVDLAAQNAVVNSKRHESENQKGSENQKESELTIDTRFDGSLVVRADALPTPDPDAKGAIYSLGRSETLKKFHSHVLPLSGEKA